MSDVRLERVSKVFKDQAAVDDVSLVIEEGEFFSLLGPSGCGKTTTLRMIGGFEEPTAGTIYLGERDVTGLPPYRRDVNTVFQSYALFPHLSIFENVAFGLRRKGVGGGDLRRRVGDALELVALGGLEKRKPRQLSGGQQQRVAIARAIVNDPTIIVADEPTGDLDRKSADEILTLLEKLNKEFKKTILMVTHDPQAAERATITRRLDKGSLS